MDAPADVYQCLAEALDDRLRSVSEDPSPDRSAQESPEVDAARRRLEADRTAVRLHAQVADQPVTYGQASFCRECGDPAPCGTIRRLSEQYGCTGT